jgi:hypothetical protein
MEPAPVTIPSNIKTITVVNRSRASDATQTIDAIHKVLSLESNELQTAGIDASLHGLTDELMKNNRFTEVKPFKRELKLWRRCISRRPPIGFSGKYGETNTEPCLPWNF